MMFVGSSALLDASLDARPTRASAARTGPLESPDTVLAGEGPPTPGRHEDLATILLDLLPSSVRLSNRMLGWRLPSPGMAGDITIGRPNGADRPQALSDLRDGAAGHRDVLASLFGALRQ